MKPKAKKNQAMKKSKKKKYVWVVHYNSYKNVIVGVYDSLEKAESVVSAVNGEYYRNKHSIQTLEVK